MAAPVAATDNQDARRFSLNPQAARRNAHSPKALWRVESMCLRRPLAKYRAHREPGDASHHQPFQTAERDVNDAHASAIGTPAPNSTVPMLRSAITPTNASLARASPDYS